MEPIKSNLRISKLSSEVNKRDYINHNINSEPKYGVLFADFIKTLINKKTRISEGTKANYKTMVYNLDLFCEEYNAELYTNSIGDNFQDNIIGANFQSNTISDNFNNCNGTLIGVDFTSETNVSEAYSCTLFTNAAGLLKLSYYDSSDVLQIITLTQM